MQRKWDRHYRETKTNISIALMLVGLSSFFCLYFVWPQNFSREVFNSRLSYYLIVDVEDYWTCTDEFNNFVIDEPSVDIRLFSFYVFNVTNTLTTVQRGFKPAMVETGPYGYQISSYKYDITFNVNDSSTVSYKEYNVLVPVEDKDACKRMFYRMDKDELLNGDPCETMDCTCKDPQGIVTIVNPLYQKVAREEGTNDLIAQYSLEIFQTLQSLMTNEFVSATKAHLVPYALEEIYVYRRISQVQLMIETAFDYVGQTSSFDTIVKNFFASETVYKPISSCGLSVYSVTGCPWNAGEAVRQIRYDIPSWSVYFKNITDNVIPYNSTAAMLDPFSSLSFRNPEVGFPSWIAISVYLGFTEFPFTHSTAMATDAELKAIYEDFKLRITQLTWPDTTEKDYYKKTFGAEFLIHVVCYYLQVRWMDLYRDTLIKLAYVEWRDTSEPVLCSVLRKQCVWQWGAVPDKENFDMNDRLIFSFIDRGAKVNTNPNSFYYDGSAADLHNTYRYCQEIIIPKVEPTSCMDIEYARFSATEYIPASLVGVDDGLSQVNQTAVLSYFRQQSHSRKHYYKMMGCNVTYLMHKIYPISTDFHDEYVIRYLNKYKLASFEHEFTVGKWDEIGYAQWGGGYVTQALVGVYSTYNIFRNGMWYIGQFDYYRGLIEYNSWALRAGYPNARISNVTESSMVLNALARDDQAGVNLRRHIMYRATTLIGDGNNLINNVGAVGEVAFLTENNVADFTCDGELSEVCGILALYVNSSAEQCLYISEDVFTACTEQARKRNNWVTECQKFETSMTSPVEGIQCNEEFVVGKAHPYIKSRGIVVEKMLFSLVIEIVLKLGLWCPTYDNCQFSRSGMFTTISVQKLLFEGYSDASINKYLAVKHKNDNVTFTCVEDAYDECGIQNFYCNHAGINVTLANESVILKHNDFPHEKFFAERFYIYQGRFIWPYDSNSTLANESRTILKYHSNEVIRMINPYFTLYPAWDDDNYEFTKFYQCQGRVLFGPPELYNSCVDTINTGRKEFKEVGNLIQYRGNSSLYPFPDHPMTVNGTTDRQMRAFLWEGFSYYPYKYQGLTAGTKYFGLNTPVLFNRQHALRLELTQNLIEEWDRIKKVVSPFQAAYDWNNKTSPGVIVSRRYTEDTTSWNALRNLGTPRDSYGMPYLIPTAMASMERLAGFPIYAGTPHNYGNYEWNGFEYSHVTGLTPIQRRHMTYIDYDPVTGKIVRKAQRQQVCYMLPCCRAEIFNNDYDVIVVQFACGAYIITHNSVFESGSMHFTHKNLYC